jgi:hypothetical protein
VALWSRVHKCRDCLVVVVHLLAARMAAMSDITKCAGYIEKNRLPVLGISRNTTTICADAELLCCVSDGVSNMDITHPPVGFCAGSF